MARENPEVVKAVEDVAETLGDDGRILVRESGTEPVIRVMVEASEDALCEVRKPGGGRDAGTGLNCRLVTI